MGDQTLPTRKLTIAERIVKISNENKISKEGKNNFANYNYFTLDSIMSELNPLLEKYNLVTLFNLTYNKEKEMYEGTLEIADAENGFIGEGAHENMLYHFDIPLTEVKGASQAQNAGATLTYCKRYLVMSAFNIADDNDDPDNEKNKPVVSKQKMTVADLVEKIKATKTNEEAMKWEEWIKKSGYSLPQMNVLQATLVEVKKKFA